MKKAIYIVISLIFLFSLSSCFTSKDDVTDAKKVLLEEWEEIIEQEEKQIVENEEKDIKKPQPFIVEKLSNNTFIEIDDLSWKDFSNWEIEITWKTLLNVDKIIVSFSNKTSEFPDDEYVLQKFNSWDSSFVYRAFSRYQTLDFWTNEYVFTAHSWTETSITKVVINIWNADEVEGENDDSGKSNIFSDQTSFEKKQIWEWEDLSYINFPKNDIFWEMTLIDSNKFWYSNISWLEIEKKDVSWIDCWNVTESLKSILDSWFYWNTCRDIIKDKWIKFNVIRLSGDKYLYERHYIDYNNSLYWIYLLESWEWVTSENIADKNDELKEKDFNQIKKVDDLFYELVR